MQHPSPDLLAVLLLNSDMVSIRQPATDGSIEDAAWTEDETGYESPGTITARLFLMEYPFSLGLDAFVHATTPPTARLELRVGEFNDLYATCHYVWNPNTERWELDEEE